MEKQDAAADDDAISIVSDTTIGSDDGGLSHMLPDLAIFKNINKCVDNVIASLDADLAITDGTDSRSSPVLCYNNEKLALPSDSQETMQAVDMDDNDASFIMSNSLLEPMESGENKQETMELLDNLDDNDVSSIMSESLLEPAELGETKQVEEKLNESIDDYLEEPSQSLLTQAPVQMPISQVPTEETSPCKSVDHKIVDLRRDIPDDVSTSSICDESQDTDSGDSQADEAFSDIPSASCPVASFHVNATGKGRHRQHEHEELRVLEKISTKQRLLREGLLNERKPTQRELSIMSCKAAAIQSILGNLWTAHTTEKKHICSAIQRAENEYNIRQWFTSLTGRQKRLSQLCQHQRTIERRIKFINSAINGDSKYRNVMLTKAKVPVSNKNFDNRLISLARQSEFTQSQKSFNRMGPRIPDNCLNIRNNTSQHQRIQQAGFSRECLHFNVRKDYRSTEQVQEGRNSRGQASCLGSRSSKRHYQEESFDQVFKDDLASLKKQCQSKETRNIGINRGIHVSASQPLVAYKSSQCETKNWNDTQFGGKDLNSSRAMPNSASLSFPTTKYFDDCSDNKAMSGATHVNHTFTTSQPQFISSQDNQSSLSQVYSRASMDSQCYSQTQQPSLDTQFVINPVPLAVLGQTGSQVQQYASNEMTHQNDLQHWSGQLPINGADNVHLIQHIQYIPQPHRVEGETLVQNQCMVDKRCVSLPMNLSLTNQKGEMDAQKSVVLHDDKVLPLTAQGNKDQMYIIVNSTPKHVPGTTSNFMSSENSMTLPSSISQKTTFTNAKASHRVAEKRNTSLISGPAGSCRTLENNEPVISVTHVDSSTVTPCLTLTKSAMMEQCGLGTDVAIVHSQEMSVADEKSKYLPLVSMIKLGLIQPGACILSFKHKEKVFLSNLLSDGQIQGVGGEMFLGPRHWIAAISGLQLKNVKKARAYDQVLYQNKPLITYLRKHEQDSGLPELALPSRQSRLPVLQERRHPETEVLPNTDTASSLDTAPPGRSWLTKLLADCKVKLIDDKELLQSDKFLPAGYWSLPFSSVHLSREFSDCIDEW